MKAPTKNEVTATTESTVEVPVERTGGVVPARYKQMYRERGNVANCGDWLATELNSVFKDAKGHFDTAAYAQMLNDNNVVLAPKTAAMPTEQKPGWQGRFRMNSGITLRRMVATEGYLVIGGKKVKAPREWLDEVMSKFKIEPKWNSRTHPRKRK